MAKAMKESMSCNGCGCGCFHHKMGPILAILFALTFIAANYGWVSMAFRDMTWPWIVLIAALSKLVNKMGMCSCGCMH